MIEGNGDNNVFRFMHLRPGKGDTGEPQPIARRAPGLRGRRVPPAVPSGPSPAPGLPAGPTPELLVSIKRELEGVVLARDLNLPDAQGNSGGLPVLALNSGGISRLSADAKSVFEQLGVPLESTRFDELVDRLDSALTSAVRRPGHRVIAGPTPDPQPARLRAVGVADLLVVKQQIKRYEAGEIAHIENVLAGESKLRTHRQLDRTEEFVSTVVEREQEKETELQTTERFELNRETSRTMDVDQKTGFGLTLSGKYGPTVEFSSNLQLSGETSEATAQKNSVQYAKEIVERSKERILERTREERRLTILREIEEINEHRQENQSDVHRAGIYQFVDKVYESQVFNYGLRQMFDFMVPEPSSYLWYLEKLPQPDMDLPVPPIRLEIEAPDATRIDEGNYLRLGARYGAKALKPPPPMFQLKSASVAQGQGNESESDQPRSRNAIEIGIPQGYRPVWAFISMMGTTDENPTVAVSFGHQSRVWAPAAGDRISLGDPNDLIIFQSQNLVELLPNDSGTTVGDEKIYVHVYGYETATYTVHVKVMFQSRPEAFTAWQVATYDALAEAYANVLMQYQQDVEAAKQRQEAKKEMEFETGNPPSANERIIRTELKKHCLAFIRNEHVGQLNTVHSAGDATTPPQFDIADALADGSQIRFFEHAFEWDQMQYVFYPYFWARPGGWADRFHARNMDPFLEEFLKAGYARVVVPVRPGFEGAVSYFLEHAAPWEGQGDPPINDPLYKPIVDEIKERTGADQGEIAVGDPWETRLPTTAILVRSDASLPEWERIDPNQWKWRPKPP
jgi:hypothetical protein